MNSGYEPILVVMKPNDGTYANNALVHGVSGLNIDGSRILSGEDYEKNCNRKSVESHWRLNNSPKMEVKANKLGRYPANVIFDKEAGEILDKQSGNLHGSGNKKEKGKGINDDYENSSYHMSYKGRANRDHNDSGGASRFFKKCSHSHEDKILENNKIMIKLITGNCLDVMREMDENSVETIITDPPYGLSFMGKKWDYDVPSIEIWKECLRVLKPGGTALIFAGSRTQHRMAINVEDAGFILKDTIMWIYGSGFPKATDISKQLDKGHERKVIGQNQDILLKQAKDLKRGKRKIAESYDKGDPERNNGFINVSADITEPATPEAKKWDGWKSHGLKPAYEPIILAMKPNDGTYANNALVHGVSGLNIDGSKIGNVERINVRARNVVGGNSYMMGVAGMPPNVKETISKGRFPANVILDEEAGEMLDKQSGILKSGGGDRNSIKDNIFKGIGNTENARIIEKSEGGASRFFYCSKTSKKERGEGNIHPTVKPLKLMEYLCNMTKTPTGGVVLDPFMGSGTTGVACKNINRDFIGIDLDEKYVEIARQRIETVNPLGV